MLNLIKLREKCCWTEITLVLHKTHKSVYVEETIMRWFRTNTVGTGRAPRAHWQERQTESLTERAVLTGPQPEPFSLFIHTVVCLSKEKGQLSSSAERKQKSCRFADRNRAWSVTKWTLAKLKVTNTMLFTCEGQGCGGEAWSPPRTQGPPYTASRRGRFRVARISCGVIERWEGEAC